MSAINRLESQAMISKTPFSRTAQANTWPSMNHRCISPNCALQYEMGQIATRYVKFLNTASLCQRWFAISAHVVNNPPDRRSAFKIAFMPLSQEKPETVALRKRQNETYQKNSLVHEKEMFFTSRSKKQSCTRMGSEMCNLSGFIFQHKNTKPRIKIQSACD